MMDYLQKQVLTQLARDFYRPTSAPELAKVLKLPVSKVAAALSALAEVGTLQEKGGDYSLCPEADITAGHYQAHIKGYGFVHVGGDRQYYVAPGTAKGARDGDIVLCAVQARNPGKAPLVRISDFLFRTERLLAAKYSCGAGLGNVQDGNKKIMIPPRDSLGAQDGDGVLVSLSRWEGKVVSILEKTDLGRLDLLNIAAKKGIVPTFPASAVKEADSFSAITPADLEKRLDLRGEDVVTIDGDGAMDLDDGFSLVKLANDNWRLGIHIADVAHYVTPGSSLDQEAFKRGLSVYLVDREVAMLPARLCRDLCSLVPDAERLAVSCLIELTPQGNVVRYQFAETIICSRQQLTYTQVDQARCGQWNEMIANAAGIVRKLNARRRERGAAYIELPATALNLDEGGRPVTMGPQQSGGAREIVEEFMILANELAADFLQQQKIAFLYRGNEGFYPGRGPDIKAFISRWGHKLDFPLPSSDLQQFLERIDGRPEQVPVSRKLARSLQKSRYSSEPLAHYNLAMGGYTHFSSPIRRYSDLFCHRQLKQAINGLPVTALERDLPRVAEQCSFRERLAQDVEGECLELKKLQFMEQGGDTEYRGMVTDMTGSGPLVWLENTAEGIVVAGASQEKLAGFTPGDTIFVRVHKLDYKAKQIYFALSEGVDKVTE